MAEDSTLLLQTKTVLTNELRLHDFSESRMAIKFGGKIEEQDKENAYLTLRFKATDSKTDFIINRHLLNFVCSDDKSGAHPQLTFNDYKIWNETNDGPNSGLNADLLDGRHATEFKDRYGYHHFVHQVNKANPDAKKNWVKIATFTTRRIGTRTDLNYVKEGTPAYGGIFQYSGNGVHGVSTDDVVVPGGNVVIPGGNIQAVSQALATMDIREQFKLNTPQFLDEYDPDVFHTTNLLTEGVYNGTLRGCVTLLRDNNPTTFDFHVGLFEDPLCTNDTKEDGGWTAVKKYFYVSLHDETLPFLTDTDDVYTSPNDDNLNKGYGKDYTVNQDTDDINKETKDVNGVVQNGYTKANPRYPNFPLYSWDYKYNGGLATKTYTNDVLVNGVSDDVSTTTTHAMANLYFTKPDGKKAEMLRELKCTYGNDYKLALETELARLKELGLAMALSDDEDSESTEFSISGLEDFKEDVDDGKDSAVNLEDNAEDTISSGKSSAAKTSVANLTETHDGPKSRIDIQNPTTPVYGNYKKPPATMQDVKPYNETRRRQPFPASNSKGESDAYQTYIDIMRLYHVDTRVDTIDGLQVVTHIYELYMAIDEKMEIRIQPYMSNGCLMYNFNECIQTADLPETSRFIRPKSIYDSRYASVRHRHYDYERRIWELTLEADQIWKSFKKYLPIDQGTDNANKVMLTDKDGKIYAADDNMVRHCEPTVINPDTGEGPRRKGARVLVTSDPDITPPMTIENCSTPLDCSCVDESDVLLDELYQLKGVKGNIQDQIDALWDALDSAVSDIWNNIGDVWAVLDELGDLLGNLEDALNSAMGNFVKKTGDIMTGPLWIDYNGPAFTEAPAGYEESNGPADCFNAIKFFNSKNGVHGGYVYGASNAGTGVGLGFQRFPGRDRDEDWALMIRPDIDTDERIACHLNGYKISFAINGRDECEEDEKNYFTIDFKELHDRVFGGDS